MPILRFQDAVAEHAQWWSALEAALYADDQSAADSLDQSRIASDEHCAIGTWLHGEGARFEKYPAYQLVKKLHKDLHDLSAQALQAKRDGEPERMEAHINSIKTVRHDLFMAWGALNDIVGAFE